jgi:hypothetical protein
VESSKRWMISRRHLLTGAGIAMGLPFLEQMMPVARGASTAAPLRFLGFFCPNGMIKDAWQPTGTGTSFTLNRTMEPLAPVKDDLLIITGVGKQGGCFRGATGHDVGTGGLLTGGYGTVSDGRLDPGTVTIDQTIAGAIGKDTKLHSIQTQVLDTHAFSRLHEHISWSGDNTPLANEQDPKALFDRLFAGYMPTNDAAAQAAAAKLKRLEGSVLDFVSTDANELKMRLGRSDNQKLDEYLSGVRDLERQLQDQGVPSNIACNPVSPAATKDPQQTIKNMLDVMVLAMQCDATRVATFMIENGLGDFVFDWLSVSGGHHSNSHHNGDPTMKEYCRVIERWEMEQFSYLLQKMKAVKDPDGSSLLDNSLVFMSSDVADGMGHTAFDLPLIIAGKAQGAVTTGRHVATIGTSKYNEDCSNVPVGNVFMSILQTFGVTVDSVGKYSTGPFSLKA